MNVIVFDVPAEGGGGLSVLRDFHQEVIESEYNHINWIFIVSTPQLKNTNNIKVINYPWIKKSWFHRLYFDNIVAPRIIKTYNSDKVLSLQNLTIPNTNAKQLVYLHNSLPFVDYQFKFSESKYLWFYQKAISPKIIKSVKDADMLIVQTEWMKNECVKKVGIDIDNIKVLQPGIGEKITSSFNINKLKNPIFFYPATAYFYKNHRVIVEAAKLLKNCNITNYEIIFTLFPEENEYTKFLKKEVEDYGLPIKFIGNIPRKEVFKYYTKAILIFPSFMETYGLPLLEARLHKAPVISSDTPFANEILKDYTNGYFFQTFQAESLSEKMKLFVLNKATYTPYDESLKELKQKNIIEYILEM